MKLKAITLALFVAGIASSYALADNGGGKGNGKKEAAATTTAATTTQATTTTPTTTGGNAGSPTGGKAIFASAGCASCHTLKAAGSHGTIGPNLDERRPSMDKVVERVTEGKGVMPSFRGQLTQAQIQSVAEFVSSATRGSED